MLQYLRQELGLSETKQTTDDLMFTVEVVSCLGACGLAPAMMVNEQVHPKMTPEKAEKEVMRLLSSGQMTKEQFAELKDTAEWLMQFLK